jgi:hypothetical protein
VILEDSMRRFVLAFLLSVVPLSTVNAQIPLSVKDIVDLTKAGLGEEVLLALIEVHRPVFPIDAETVKMLKDAGVRQNVIVAMVKSGREYIPVAPAPEPQPVTTAAPPPVVVIDHADRVQPERVREVAVPVAVPVYVPVRVRPRHDDDRPPTRVVEPVYWGFGGKRRPDTWDPDPVKKPSRPFEPQKK